MDSKILSYADEILSMDTAMTRYQARLFLIENYGDGLETEDRDAVLDVLEGEGYFDGE